MEPTPEIPADERPREDAEAAGRILVGRFGSFFLSVEKDADKAEILAAIANALNDDSRVLPFQQPEPNEHWDRKESFFPAKPPPTNEQLLTAEDRAWLVRFREPIEFTVRVQKKNQPVFRTWKKIPAEEYFVRWDGKAFMIFWEQSDRDGITPAAGHVAKQVIKEAAERVGASVYFQGCSPGCEFEFGHSALRVTASPDIVRAVFRANPDDRDEVFLELPSDGFDPEWLATAAYHTCRSAIDLFSNMKNLAQRLFGLDHLVAGELPTLLGYVRHTRSEVYTMPFWERLGERWTHRRWRRETAGMMDELWLAMAHLEQVRRMWSGARFRFERDAAEDGDRPLFEGDHVADVAEIQSLDLAPVQTAVNEIGSRLDARDLVHATLIAAGSGIVGVFIGWVIAH